MPFRLDNRIDKILKYKSFISGVTVSGGECTTQMDYLINLVKELKNNGLNTLVDTNAYFILENAEELIENAEGFMIDFKMKDEEKHIELTGLDNRIIIHNIKELLKLGKIYELRTVVYEESAEIEETIKYINDLVEKLKSPVRYKIIKYRDYGVRDNMRIFATPSDEYIEKLESLVTSEYIEEITV